MNTDLSPIRPLLLHVTEAAELLGISRATMYREIEAGRIKTVRIGRARRVPLRALEAYVAELETRATHGEEDHVS